nr:unnamed protein product [Digitaria exilis]
MGARVAEGGFHRGSSAPESRRSSSALPEELGRGELVRMGMVACCVAAASASSVRAALYPSAEMPVAVEDRGGAVTLMLASLFLLGNWTALLTLLERRGRLLLHTYLH